MAYSCADLVEDLSGLFPDQQPDGDEDWESAVLIKFIENITTEVERLRAIEAATVKAAGPAQQQQGGVLQELQQQES